MTSRARALHRDGDRGFTLIELVIATVLSGIIAGVIIAALATSLRVASSTTNQIADSTDRALVSAFLFRDAQAAGGATDPATQVEGTVGVSTSETPPIGWTDCPQTGLFIRFSWIDPRTETRVDVTYAHVVDDARGAGYLTRRECRGGTGVDVVLGNDIAVAKVECEPRPGSAQGATACDGLPESVSLTLNGGASGNLYEYTLTASLRPGLQELPKTSDSSVVSLVVLGSAVLDAGVTTPCLQVNVPGIRVNGDAVVGPKCGIVQGEGTSPYNLVQPPGETRILTGLTDPFADLRERAPTCDLNALARPGETVTLHRDRIDIYGLEPLNGIHVYCDGLTLGAGAAVTGNEVFLYILGGELTISPTAKVDLTAPVAGAYANMLISVASSQKTVRIGGGSISRYVGQIHAPTSAITVVGTAPTMLGGIVADTIDFAGSGPVRLGLPVPVITITPATAPSGQVGDSYETPLFAGGEGPDYVWSAPGLPPGINLVVSPDTSSAVLTGTPTMAGTYTVDVTVSDTFATTTLTIDISIAGLLPRGRVGEGYSESVVLATGATPPFVWSATGLPAGLTIDSVTGTVAGIPMVAGTSTIVVHVTDANSLMDTATYTVTIEPPFVVIATTSLPTGQVGEGYTETVVATGGTPLFVWSATGLPAGLTIDSGAGTVTGTPTVAGTSTVVVQVTDANSMTDDATYTVTIEPAFAVGTTSLPRGQVGVDYPATAILAIGGTPPFVWSATGLPTGLTIDSGTGTVAGTPTVAGTFPVDVQITDATGTMLPASYSIVIDPALAVASPETLPDGQRNVAYPATTFVATGGQVPRTWSASGLPTGLTIATTTGVITGTPTATGVSTVVVRVTDAAGLTANRSLSLKVTACPVTVAGWRAEYFDNMSLTGEPKFCRYEPNIDHNWGAGSPDTVIPVNRFSARWTRDVDFTAGTYRFALGSDDGSRLYIDGKLVLELNRWSDRSYPNPVPTVDRWLQTGSHTIVVEYYENGGAARAKLSWIDVSNGVTAESSVYSYRKDNKDYRENRITLKNTSAITAMTVTIVVDDTTDLSDDGMRSDFGNNVNHNSDEKDGSITYTFVLKSNRSVLPGEYLLVAETKGKGTLQPTSGDTWTVVTTSNGVTNTQTGTF